MVIQIFNFIFLFFYGLIGYYVNLINLGFRMLENCLKYPCASQIFWNKKRAELSINDVNVYLQNKIVYGIAVNDDVIYPTIDGHFI